MTLLLSCHLDPYEVLQVGVALIMRIFTSTTWAFGLSCRDVRATLLALNDVAFGRRWGGCVIENLDRRHVELWADFRGCLYEGQICNNVFYWGT